MEDIKEEFFACSCHTHGIAVSWFSEDIEGEPLSIEFWEMPRYHEVFKWKVIHYLRRLWMAITNNKSQIYDVALYKEDVKKLYSILGKYIKEKKVIEHN